MVVHCKALMVKDCLNAWVSWENPTFAEFWITTICLQGLWLDQLSNDHICDTKRQTGGNVNIVIADTRVI